MATNTTTSFSDHIGNNTAGPFSISFSYLAQSEVKVYVNGVLKTVTTHYTFPSTTTISFTSGNHPANGALIKFQRSTDVSTKRADFSDGSVLTEADLDANANQMIYSVQELIEEVYTSASATPPANPQNGSKWFDSVSGRTYVYYIDTASSQWVEMSPAFDGKVNNVEIVTQDLIDNQKIRWGTGFDLEIFHDGSNSYIKDAGVGDLIISSGTDTSAKFITDGAVELYHNNVKKIETTVNGITVTGGITATGAIAPSATSGDWWGHVPYVNTDGVMEVGKFLDFHETDAGTTDRDVRVMVVDNIKSTPDKVLGVSLGSSYGLYVVNSTRNINHFNWVVSGSDDYFEVNVSNANGTTQARGIHDYSSDINLKENIIDSTYDALRCIKDLKLRSFDWNTDKSGRTGNVKCGVIAQEIETVNSGLVTTLSDGVKTINPLQTITISLKAIQDLLSKVETLETKVTALEAK